MKDLRQHSDMPHKYYLSIIAILILACEITTVPEIPCNKINQSFHGIFGSYFKSFQITIIARITIIINISVACHCVAQSPSNVYATIGNRIS